MKIIKNYNNIESAYLIDSEKQGQTISIFSGIHGDEVSGIVANEKILNKLINGDIKLKKGRLILIIKCNEEAIKINKREVKFNMNRLFIDNIKTGNSYEEKRVLELKEILKESDYFLDLHSTSGPSIPFAYIEKEHFDFGKKLGISHIISGWGSLGDVISGDTETYVNQNGGVAITFESGNHTNKDGSKNAYQAILNFLSNLGVINSNHFLKIGENEKCFLEIKSFYKAKSDNFKYKININNFLKIKKGTLIGLDDGEKVVAKEDMILVMPKSEHFIKKGTEVFFTGIEIK